MVSTIEDITKVKDIPEKAILINEIQDIRFLWHYLGNAEEYNSFFVVIGYGEYEDIWGVQKAFPEDDDEAFKLL
jgi:hypothetical protein